MGRTRTTVGTSIARVITDDLIPTSAKTSISQAIYENGELSEYLIGNFVESIALKAERMYDYAERGLYTYGLPSGQTYNPIVDATAVTLATLASIEGAPVTLEYLRYGAPNNLHIGWLKLVSDHGYIPETNKLGALSTTLGVDVYLEDMVVVVPSTQVISTKSLEQWGIAPRAMYTPEKKPANPAYQIIYSHTPVKLEVGGTSEYLLVSYVSKTNDIVSRGTFTIPVTGYEDNLDYFQAKYTVGTAVKYWMYKDGTGTYPLQDAIYDKSYIAPGSFFPFTYFRYEKLAQNTDKNTPAYLSSVKLCKYLGLNFDEVTTNINDPANPDIADVEQAMMMLVVPANTTNPIERRYLWDFFNRLFMSNPAYAKYSTEIADSISDSHKEVQGFNPPGIVIKDTRFKLSLDCDGIYKRNIKGTIGVVGAYTSGFETKVTIQKVVDLVTGIETTITSPIKHHYYRKQTTAGVYEEIQVVGMQTAFHIFGDYTAIGDETDSILLVPLDRSLTGNYSLPDKEVIYARSLHYVFNSKVVTKLKWYQTGVFKAILIVVAVVAIVTGYWEVTNLIITLVEAGAYTAAAFVIIGSILKLIVISYIFKVLVKAAGAKVALILAVIAAVVGLTNMVEAGSIQGAPFAAELLAISTGLSKEATSLIAEDMQGLFNEYKEFEAEKEEKTELLQDAQDLLSNPARLSPFVVFGESPNDFYNRTVHSGNIGVMSIDAISNYVDMQLTLPKLKDTLGVNKDGL